MWCLKYNICSTWFLDIRISICFYNSLYRGMHIKAIIVVCAFSVQYFKNATIVVYKGLRVKKQCETK